MTPSCRFALPLTLTLALACTSPRLSPSPNPNVLRHRHTLHSCSLAAQRLLALKRTLGSALRARVLAAWMALHCDKAARRALFACHAAALRDRRALLALGALQSHTVRPSARIATAATTATTHCHSRCQGPLHPFTATALSIPTFPARSPSHKRCMGVARQVRRRITKQMCRVATDVAARAATRCACGEWAARAVGWRHDCAEDCRARGLREAALRRRMWGGWARYHLRKQHKVAVLRGAAAAHQRSLRQAGCAQWLQARGLLARNTSSCAATFTARLILTYQSEPTP